MTIQMKTIMLLEDETGDSLQKRTLNFIYLQEYIEDHKHIQFILFILQTHKINYKTLFLATILFKRSKLQYLKYKEKPQIKQSFTLQKEEPYEFVMANNTLLFIVNLMISAKSLEDIALSNLCWSLSANLDQKKLSLAEISVIRLLEWEIMPTEIELNRAIAYYCDMFETIEFNLESNSKKESIFRKVLNNILGCLGKT